MSKDFCHLHIHTESSLLDGIIKIDRLCNYVKEKGMTACAITDHGTMGGVIEFYKAAKSVGIKPLIGIESYVTFDKDNILDNKDKTKDNLHCVMIAQNEIGFRNLIWLSNRGTLHNFYYKPRISIDNLTPDRTEGIIATSACLGGIAAKLGIFNKETNVFEDPDGLARKQLELFSTIFRDRFYVEIQDHPFREQEAYNTWLIKNAKELNIPLVITSDAHFLTEDDYETHRLVMAKNTGKLLSEYKEDDDGLIYQRTHHVRTPEEMYKSSSRLGIEEAFTNTLEVVERCNLEIKLGEYKYPKFDITQESDYEEFLSWEKQYETRYGRLV